MMKFYSLPGMLLICFFAAACAPLNDDIKQRNMNQLQLDLAKGNSPNATDFNHRTALWMAAYYDNYEAVQLLLRAGADPNIVDSGHHDTPLMFAAGNGNVDIVKALLDAKADPNIQNNKGQTALHYAAMNSRYEVARILVSHGASLRLQNSKGQVPEDLATGSEMIDALGGK